MITLEKLSELFTNTEQFQSNKDEDTITLTPCNKLDNWKLYSQDKIINIYVDGVTVRFNGITDIQLAMNEDETAIILDISVICEDPFEGTTQTIILPMYTTREVGLTVFADDTLIGISTLNEEEEG